MSERVNTQTDRLLFASNDALGKLAKDTTGQLMLAERMATWWQNKLVDLVGVDAVPESAERMATWWPESISAGGVGGVD